MNQNGVSSIFPGEYLVVAGDPSVLDLPVGTLVVDAGVPNDFLQNNASDGLVLYDTINQRVVDSVVYEGGAPMITLGQSTFEVAEGTASPLADLDTDATFTQSSERIGAFYLDISTTGDQTVLGDDGEVNVVTTVGNRAFPAGATTIGNNGAVVATNDANPTAGNTNLPSNSLNGSDSSAPAFAVFWDDLDNRFPGNAADGVYFEEQFNLTILGQPGVSAQIIQWHQLTGYELNQDNNNPVDFQIQIFDDSAPISARMVYQDTEFGTNKDFGASATIGYQRTDTTGGAQHSLQAAILMAEDNSSDEDVIDVRIGFSIGRLLGAEDTQDNASDFEIQRPTPGKPNFAR